MKNVCVITGGGSGIGFATAKILVKQGYLVILAGRTLAKLDKAVQEIQAEGGEAKAFACDVASSADTKGLADYAKSCGIVKVVIHAAGLSPHMGDSKVIMEGNALGTVHINDAFYGVIAKGGCMIDVSSMSGYMLPKIIIPKKVYGLCRVNQNLFLKKILRRIHMLPKKNQAGFAYALSKNFVLWYARTDAARFGEKGVRVLSVTPGNFETPMGNLEKDEGDEFIQYNTIKRFGKPEEIALLMSYLVDERLGYLTGADIVCDGGCIASERNPMVRK